MEKAPSDSIEKNLLISVWGLGILSLFSLILTRELSPVTVLSVLTLTPAIFCFELREKLAKNPFLENSLILILPAGSLYRLAATKTSFLIVIADFLVAFILLKFSFRKERKDLIQIIALSFFLLLSTSTLALDFMFIISFILYVLAAAWTLSLYSLMQDENSGTLLLADPFSKKTNEKKMIFRFISGYSLLTLGLVLILSTMIFVFFPRLSLAVFQGAFLGPVHKSGFSEKMNLAHPRGKIFEDSTVEMRVETDTKEKELNLRYLRGQTLNYFDGTEWSAGTKNLLKDEHQSLRSSVASLSATPSPPVTQNVQDSPKGRIIKVRKIIRNRFDIYMPDASFLQKEFSMKLNRNSYLIQKIYLESVDTSMLFGIPWIESIEAKLPQVTMRDDNTVTRPNEFSGRIFYQVKSMIERPDEKILSKKILPETGQKFAADLQLPPLDFSEIRNLLTQIVSEEDPPYVKAKKTESYLRKNYRYTTQFRSGGSTHPTNEFLLRTKAGHCEHFASAMAVMLRLSNIPSRIATGFLMDEWNSSGNYFVIRSKDAHSWVEVCIGGIWIEMDPSPTGKEENTTATWTKLRQKLDYLNFLWNAHILGYDMESQRKIAKAVELKSNSLSSAIDRSLDHWRSKFQKMTGIGHYNRHGKNEVGQESIQKNDSQIPYKWIILTSLMIYLLIKKREIFTKRGEFKDKLRWSFYSEFLKILSKKGYTKKNSETPYEFIEKLSSETVLMQNEVGKLMIFLTNLFYKSRFSDKKLSTNEISEIKESLKKLRKQIN